MRLTRFLLVQYRRGNKTARAPQDLKKVPFKSILPLQLRERGWFKKYLHKNHNLSINQHNFI